MMKFFAAIVAFTTFSSLASAAEFEGKVGDFPGVAARLVTAGQSMDNFDAVRLAKVEKAVAACHIHVTATTVEGTGRLRCDDIGLKVDAEIRRTASGLKLAEGECTVPQKYVAFNSLLGWSNSTSICNIGGTRYRMTGSAKIPSDLKI